MKPITHEWLVFAQKDLAGCARMLGDGFLTSIVSFHAQQAVEKSFKAIIEEFELGFIRTHDLVKLYGIVQSHLQFEIDLEMVKKLNELYTGARYPGEFGLLPDGEPTVDDADAFYQFAKGVFEQTSKMLTNADDEKKE